MLFFYDSSFLSMIRAFDDFVAFFAGTVELVDVSKEMPNLIYEKGLHSWKVSLFSI